MPLIWPAYTIIEKNLNKSGNKFDWSRAVFISRKLVSERGATNQLQKYLP